MVLCYCGAVVDTDVLQLCYCDTTMAFGKTVQVQYRAAAGYCTVQSDNKQINLDGRSWAELIGSIYILMVLHQA